MYSTYLAGEETVTARGRTRSEHAHGAPGSPGVSLEHLAPEVGVDKHPVGAVDEAAQSHGDEVFGERVAPAVQASRRVHGPLLGVGKHSPKTEIKIKTASPDEVYTDGIFNQRTYENPDEV